MPEDEEERKEQDQPSGAAEEPDSEADRPSDAAPPQGREPPPEAGLPPDTVGLVITCLTLLAARAWEAMGLVPNPSTGKVARQMDDAQLAIDAAAALADLVRPRVPERERREIETLLTNLRLNFVEQKGKAP